MTLPAKARGISWVAMDFWLYGQEGPVPDWYLDWCL